MSLKNEIEKTMFKEGIEDRFQDIASLIDSPVEDVQKRMKTLSFSDYVKVMSALKSKDESTIKSMMGLSESIATDIKDYVDDHKKHFDAYPMDVEVGDKVYDYDEYWEILDKVYPDMKQSEVKEGWSQLPDMPEKYIARDGLEGPIMTKSGKVVYYDTKEGSYYDPDTDIFLSYDEWKSLDENYNMGSQGKFGSVAPGEMQGQEEPSAMDMKAANTKLKSQRTQAMQRLGRDNLGGATAQMAANAIDNAEQGKVLTPIQRQALAHQAANLDNLAMNPDTRIQFRNLLNKLNRGQE